jgi:hypothetical protein
MNITKNNDAFLVEWTGGRSDQKEYLLISDVHFDSKKCNRAALKRTMDEAMNRDAGILIFGDFFDVMGSRADKRASKSDLRPEYLTSNYLEAIIDDGVEFLKTYAANLLFIGQGNHELTIKKFQEIDILSVLAYKLRAEAGWSGMIGGYEGWIQFRQRRNQHAAITRTMFFTHGTGGNSPVTRGTIATNRRQVNIDADIFVSGHIHTQWSMPINRRVLNDKGNEELREVLHLQLGTYKESHLDRNGWEAMKGFAAPNIGGYWLKFGFGKGEQSEILTFIEERTR